MVWPLSAIISGGKRALTRLFKDKTELAIFLTAFLTEIVLGVYLICRWGATYAFGFDRDLQAHLYISRVVVDNGAHSGLAMLGTTWLPLFHILLAPFVAIDAFYTTGFAGTIVNSIMVGGICVLLYRLAGKKLLGGVASALFLINVYTLLHGTSSYMAPAAMFFALLSVYYFKLYWRKDSLAEFMKCGLALTLATLGRYEAWIVAALTILLFILRELKNGHRYRLAYAHFPLWGIFAWLFWNLAIWRDPLIWMNAPWLTGTYYQSIMVKSLLISPEKFVSYYRAFFPLAGFLSVLVPMAVLAPLIRRDHAESCKALLISSPLILGFAVPSPLKLYFALPGLLTPLFVANHINKKWTKIALITCLVASYSVIIPNQYTSLQSFSPQSFTFAYDEVASVKNVINKGSYILACSSPSTSSSRTLSVVGGLSPSKIIDEYDGSLFADASRKPWQHCDYVIIDKIPPNEQSLKRMNDYYGCHFLYKYYYDSIWRSAFLDNYKLVLETDHFLVYQLG